MNHLPLLAQSQSNDIWVKLYESRGAWALVVLAFFIGVVYFALPAAKVWWKRRQDTNQSLDAMVRKRVETLQQQRDEDFERMRDENMALEDKISSMDKKLNRLVRQNAKMEQKLRSFEWLFLVEVCDALVEMISHGKMDIVKRLEGKIGQELADMIDAEFNKLIAELKNYYVVRQLEKQLSMFKMTDEDEEERSSTVHRNNHEEHPHK